MTLEAIETEFKNYINNARSAHTHPAKLSALTHFLDRVYNVRLIELIPGIEKKIGSSVLGVRGSIDLLFSYVVIEIKTDLKRELDDATSQLVKYFQALYEHDPNRKYVGIVTDGLTFIAYYPVFDKDEVADVKEISRINLANASIDNSIVWIDSFLFSKSGLRATAEDLSLRFGPGSPTHALAKKELDALWKEVEDAEEVSLKLRLWTKNMAIVYGNEPSVDAFLDHTYLVTLVKLLIYLRLSGSATIDSQDIRKALTGEYFVSFGILNLIEEDYFSWILNPKLSNKAVELSNSLAKELLKYDISGIDEDLFKEIYQTIVRRGQRHRTGEYYTPEWLSEITLKHTLEFWFDSNKSVPRILDPGCGSGTFLTNAIHYLHSILSKKKMKPSELLDVILDNIVGMDINPVAVVIARANYIIALGKLLQTRKQITIPIYAADSIRLPAIIRTFISQVDVFDIEADGSHLQIPVRIVSNRSAMGQLLDAFKVATNAYRLRKNRKESLGILENRTRKILHEDELEVVKVTLDTIMDLIDKKLNSIWIFVLSNIYAPIALKERKFDIIIGNPPWIVMRTIENKNYQDFLKDQVFRYGLLKKEREQIKLFTHMEMATLFYCRTSDLYLKDSGIISFLMPISVITAAQHHINFKNFDNPKQKLLTILNFQEISNIFSLPVCIIIAKKGERTKYPITAIKYSGNLGNYRRNEKLSVVSKAITSKPYKYELPIAPLPKTYSVYFENFREGATLVPRNLWFVTFNVHPTLGIDIARPSLETSEEVMEVGKEAWKDIELKGNVESEYVYATILGKDLIPFGYVKFRPIVLPLEPQSDGFRLFDVDSLRSKGSTLMANWLEKNQKIWEQRRTSKSKINYPRVIDRLDHQALLTSQNPKKRFVVIFNARGADAMAHVIDRRRLPAFKVGSYNIKPKGFVADTTDFYCEFDDEDEAHYLCAILNSRIMNAAVKPFQPRGQYGHRDIGRRPLMLPIPKFDAKNKNHTKLVQISKKCHSIVTKHEFPDDGFRAMRNEALRILKDKLDKIDELVSDIMNI